MRTNHFHFRSTLHHPVNTVFAWHEQPGALHRLTPPWEKVRFIRADRGIKTGARITARLSLLGPITKDWVAEHADYNPPHLFRDIQVAGPFAHCDHKHHFSAIELPDRTTGTLMHDHLEYAPPLALLTGTLADPLIRTRLQRMFRYRHATLTHDLNAHAQYAHRPRLTILITGATGLIGTALDAYLTTAGHTVRRLTRANTTTPPGDAARPDHWYHWSPDEGRIDERALEGLDVIIHLAAENLSAQRWSPRFKQRLVESRLLSTALLAERLAARPPSDRPSAFLTASGIHAYPDTGDQPATEDSPLAPAGTHFLADLTRSWEAAALPARDAGIRTAALRLAAVLTPAGGALKAKLTPARLGLAGPLGPGTQHLPWISIDDALDAILRIIMTDTLEGPINLVAPTPTTQREFIRTLARILNRPAILPAPAPLLRAAFGPIADAILLASCNAAPAKLLSEGHSFRHPDLESALRHLLARARPLPNELPNDPTPSHPLPNPNA
ncbi:MAG: TIGR01777 family oxidoreductase [Phycisphaerales bacterium]